MFGIYLSKNQNKWIDYWKKQPIYTENVVFCRLPASLLLLYLFSICDSLSILCVLRVCRLSLQPYVLGFAADSKPTFLHQHQCIEMGRTRDDTKHLMMHTQHTAYSKRARARYSHVHRMEMLWGTRTLRSLSLNSARRLMYEMFRRQTTFLWRCGQNKQIIYTKIMIMTLHLPHCIAYNENPIIGNIFPMPINAFNNYFAAFVHENSMFILYSSKSSF